MRLANGFTGTDDEKPRNRKRRDATTTVSFDGGGRARHDEFKQDFFSLSLCLSLSFPLFFFTDQLSPSCFVSMTSLLGYSAEEV